VQAPDHHGVPPGPVKRLFRGALKEVSRRRCRHPPRPLSPARCSSSRSSMVAWSASPPA